MDIVGRLFESICVGEMAAWVVNLGEHVMQCSSSQRCVGVTCVCILRGLVHIRPASIDDALASRSANQLSYLYFSLPF